VPKALLDTSVYIDLQRAKNFRQQPWAFNSLRRITAYSRQHGRPFLSTMNRLTSQRVSLPVASPPTLLLLGYPLR
jgi:hypothetical protein